MSVITGTNLVRSCTEPQSIIKQQLSLLENSFYLSRADKFLFINPEKQAASDLIRGIMLVYLEK